MDTITTSKTANASYYIKLMRDLYGSSLDETQVTDIFMDMDYAKTIELLKSVPVSKLWITAPIGTALSDNGVQSAYDVIMLRNEELNQIANTGTDVAEQIRRDTITSVILMKTNVKDIGPWSDDTMSHLTASHTLSAYDVYHHHRIGWTKHMSDESRDEIQKNLDKFMNDIDTMFSETKSPEGDSQHS